MRSSDSRRPRLAAWTLLLWTLTLLLASSASGSDSAASSTPASATGTDPCAVLREAYRLRLGDLAVARRDSAVAVARAQARGDSLAVELRWRDWQLAAEKDSQPAWYETHDAGVIKGAVIAFLAVWLAGRIE